MYYHVLLTDWMMSIDCGIAKRFPSEKPIQQLLNKQETKLCVCLFLDGVFCTKIGQSCHKSSEEQCWTFGETAVLSQQINCPKVCHQITGEKSLLHNGKTNKPQN